MTASFLSYLFGCLCINGASWFVMVSEQLNVPAEEGQFLTFSMLYAAVALLLCIPLGLFCDLTRSNGRVYAASGCLVCAIGVLLAHSHPALAAVLLGIGTAAFLAGGLCDAVTQNGGMTRIGIFLSMILPGVAIGKKCGNFKKFPGFYFIVLLCFCALLLFYFCRHKREEYALPDSRKLFGLQFPLLPIPWLSSVLSALAAVCILFAGLCAKNPGSESRFAWLIPAAACFAGAFLGGVLADLFGAVFTGPVGLCLGAVLLAVGKEKFLLYAGALFFLGFALPAAVGTAEQSLRGKEGRGISLLALGAAGAWGLSVLTVKDDIVLPGAVLPAICVLGALLLAFSAGRNVFPNKK